MFNMRIDFMHSDAGIYVAGDIIRVSELPREFQSPPNSRTARTQYAYLRNVPGEFSQYAHLSASKYNPPIDPDDPHSGGIKHARQYYFDVPGYAVANENPSLTPIEDQWSEVAPWLKDKETGSTIRFQELVRRDGRHR